MMRTEIVISIIRALVNVHFDRKIDPVLLICNGATDADTVSGIIFTATALC